MLARLDLFRGYIDRLDPAAGPLRALREELYVDPPGRPVGAQLAARLQLAPSSAHLVVGGVGAGKSTQLLRAAQLLRSTGDTQAAYVDVSRRHDLDKDLRGVLTVLAGVELSRLLSSTTDPAVKEICEQFTHWAHGHREFVPYDPSDDDDSYYDDSGEEGEPGRYVYRPGILSPALPPISSDIHQRLEALKRLKQALPAETRHFVILFDSLDRLGDADAFRRAAIEDVRALRQAGIGLVVVGPGRLVYGQNRSIVDLFDQLHSAPALDVARDKAAREFLGCVLTKRTDNTVLPPAVREKLVILSGGILRDLLGLTRAAVEEAFVEGADSVTDDHVARSADQFGRSMMIGLRSGELQILQRLRLRGTFVATNDDELALLESRRVLEYPGVTTRYAVHPTIEPLLASLDGGK